MRFLTILVLILAACNGPIQVPSGGGLPPPVQDVATGVDTPESDAGAPSDVPDPVESDASDADIGNNKEVDSVHPDAEPATTLAEQFEAAGGVDLCRAAVYALSPELDPVICSKLSTADRRTRCTEQRAPLQEFVSTVCTTVLEESARFDLDPLMVLAVMERESSMGRVEYVRSQATYEVETDICSWFLSKTRIRSREPGRREGTERIAWTYGDDINTQQVRVLEETDEGLRINTCVAGEEGLMQTVPREFRRGTVIAATGETLDGSSADRREQVAEDPVLQVRLGCHSLAAHRNLCPESDRRDAWLWLPTYNIGRCDPDSEKWVEYLGKIRRHYLDACEGYVPDESGLPRLIRDLWPECERVESYTQ